MFKKHPKGLLTALLINMCVCFGFNVMMANLMPSLKTKFNLGYEEVGIIYSTFYFSIFVLTVAGGIIADKIKNHKGTVFAGIISMAAGCLIIAIPTPSTHTVFFVINCLGLLVIASGKGLINGNLYAVIGQMYDDPKYSEMRDAGFSLSYIFVCLSSSLSMLTVTFIIDYETGFHSAFAVFIFAMAISSTIYLLNKKKLPTPATTEIYAIKIDVKEIRQRLFVLLAVWAVFDLFCVSFNQNGLTLTFFARDYVNLKDFEWGCRTLSYIHSFIVVLFMPVLLVIFGVLRAKGKEPSAPKKMVIGMGIAACAYILLASGSIGLPDAAALNEIGWLPETERLTPFLLIGAYFILTLAGLFIIPVGMSFVSKVSPLKYQGIMQSIWVSGAGISNGLLTLGVILYKHIPVWATWTIFSAVCFISMIIMLIMLKWIEKVAKYKI